MSFRRLDAVQPPKRPTAAARKGDVGLDTHPIGRFFRWPILAYMIFV